jgi:hypothetical protein
LGKRIVPEHECADFEPARGKSVAKAGAAKLRKPPC